MRIVSLAPNRATIELETTDCLAIVSGLSAGFDKTAQGIYSQLATAFLAAAYCAYLLASDDDPKSVEHMWAMWAPLDTDASERETLRCFGGLPVSDTSLIDGMVHRG